MALLSGLAVSYELVISPRYDILKLGPTDQNFIQRRNKSPFGAYHTMQLKFDRQSAAAEKILYDWYCARKGPLESFQLFDPDANTAKWWADVYLGTGNGSTTVFDLRGKSTTNVAVTVNGTSNSNWSKGSGTGVDGQDRLTFSPAPTGIIKAQFNGVRYFPNVIFKDDSLDRTLFTVQLYRTGVTLIEVSA
jgi:hypothetical protein